MLVDRLGARSGNETCLLLCCMHLATAADAASTTPLAGTMAPKLPVLTYSVFSQWALAFCMWWVVAGSLRMV